MELLNYRFEGGEPMTGATTLVGVLSSGNLEILVESAALDQACEIEICTAAAGFGDIWQAGATPAVVSLRLDQAMESFANHSGKP